MNMLIVNVGSSSVKVAIFQGKKKIGEGLKERIHNKQGYLYAFKEIIKTLEKKNIKIDAIGHRVAHGGRYRSSQIINNTVIREIKKYASFVPLHNPPELLGIQLCKKFFKNKKQVAVFDTSFFANLPEKAYTYAINKQVAKKYNIRKYGFHGTSHQYVAEEAAKLLKKPLNKLKLATVHLGNGCSIAAIDKGKAVDTTLGISALAGLVMGSRSGDIDPAIIQFLAKKGWSIDKIFNMLNKESGLKGLSGSSDIRDIINNKKKEAKLALAVFTYAAAKHLAAMITALNGADAIVFTAGIGSHVPKVRTMIMNNLSYLGKIKVLVIKTNEELMIAREVRKLIKNKNY